VDRVVSVVFKDRDKDVLINFPSLPLLPLDLLVHPRVVALRNIRVVMMSNRYEDGGALETAELALPTTAAHHHLPVSYCRAAGRCRGREGIAMPKLSLVPLLFAIACFGAPPTWAAGEPDLIFKRSTVFKLLTPNDKLATYGLDDPEVDGVACHFTVPERAGVKGWLGVAEEVSDISLACRQIGPIRFKAKFAQGEDVFHKRRSLFFKKMQIVPATPSATCWSTWSIPTA
jgi:catabolite regulation protein CreA